MPPRGGRGAKKAKRPEPKVAAAKDTLPDLESYLIELSNWPDVTDILAANHFKVAMEQFSNISDFRSQLKEVLSPCYGKKKIPRTPKKLAHKVPPRPIPEAVRVIDFDLDVNADATGNSTVIAVTGVVPQTPVTKIQAPGPSFTSSKGLAAQTQSPFNRICAISTVISSTPSSNPATRATIPINTSSTPAPNQSIRFGAQHPALHLATPKSNGPSKSQMLQEINQKLEIAGIRHENYVREQQERVARDNEQRKRRVNQNLQQKQQEEERKQQQFRQQQERIRRFEDAQRSPKPALKAVTPAKVVTPAKIQTPGQKAVPQKRQKQDEEESVEEYVAPIRRTNSKSRLPVPKPRPNAINKAPPKPSIEEVVISVQMQEASIVEDSESIHREEFSSAVELMETEEPAADKENQERTPHATPRPIKTDTNEYNMTPDKVFQPSTENDYNVDDLSSGDETDNEDNPRKKVPRWAEKSALRAHVQQLFRHISKDAVNAYFGVLKAPRIATLFSNSEKNYDAHNETTAWDSPIANPRSAPLVAKQRN